MSDDETIYVRSDAKPGGDGTAERPFATIAEAFEYLKERVSKPD